MAIELMASEEYVDGKVAAEAQARTLLAATVQTHTSSLASLSSRVGDNETAIANRYTKSEVDAKVAGVQTFQKLVVNELPSAEAADDKTIYLVPRTGSETPDLCDEYVTVGVAGSRRWEKIGDTTIDLSGKADKVANATSGNLAALDSNGNLTDSGKKPADFAAASHTHSASQVSGLGDAATKNVGTAAGTVAAGDHTHSQYATKAEMDAATTLSPGYSPWEFRTDGSLSNSFFLRWEPTDDPEDDGGGWGWHLYLKHDGDPMLLSQTAKGTLQSTSLSWSESEMVIPSTFDTLTVTRTAVEGYFLGGDTEHPLADAAETDRRLAAKAAFSDLPYAISESTPLMVSGGAASTMLADRTHNVRTVAAPGSGNTTTITATLPPIVAGKSRDMFLNLTVGSAASDAGDISLSIVEPSGATVQIDIGSVEDIGIGKNEILITENALPSTSGNVTTTHWLVTVRHEDFA